MQGDLDPRFRWDSNGGRLTGSESLRSPADLVLPEAPFKRPSRSRPPLRPTRSFVVVVVVAAVVAGYTDTFRNKQYTLPIAAALEKVRPMVPPKKKKILADGGELNFL